MTAWRVQGARFPLINSEGAQLTGGRWNLPGTAVIYASESLLLAAMEVIVHHGGIPVDYVGIRIEIPEDVRIEAASVPPGWPDLVPESVTAVQGTAWANEGRSAVLTVPSATMSVAGTNYILNPLHADFKRIQFFLAEVRFDSRLRV